MSPSEDAPDSAADLGPAPSRPGDAGPRARVVALFDRLCARWPRIDGILYPIFASACVLYAAGAFYGYLHLQTRGGWSAPLDDVFIHFDYARATARGYPFQWSEGNGFSSGNTSLTYPFVLSLGYLVGFRGLDLMFWAAIVACLATLGFLLAVARLFEPLGRWAKYLAPPAVLSLGALDWSLFSGMENAFHLGMWGLTLAITLATVRAAQDPGADDARARTRVRRLGWLAGLAGALLFATRPESVVCAMAFAVFAAVAVRRRFGSWAAITTILRVGLPGAVVVVAQAGANRLFTGEWAANGAIAKLALNNPYMTAGEKWDQYVFLLEYVVLRNTQHHFADKVPWGWLVPLLAAVPLVTRATRPAALLLWAQVVGWLLLVSLNGQVRWQNERYTMAAVAWILVLAAMGVAVIMGALSSPAEPGRLRLRPFALRAGRIAVGIVLMAVYWRHQEPNMRDQIWFFGRASRNIRDQHVVTGLVLAKMGTRRVLVGDAGAILYASDRPGLDLIGLGGYHDLPFARATVHGLGAALELIERMPREQRPDTMAIYPSWWGDLPTIFGERVTEVPVIGNVICGGAEKVIYRADWRALDRAGKPRSLRAGERVVDELDVADLVSEKAHAYEFPRPQRGFVEFRVLADPADSSRDLFDAGRLIPGGSRETAQLRAPTGRGRLVMRTAAGRVASINISVAGRPLGRLTTPKGGGGWMEASLDLPVDLPASFEVSLEVVEGEWVNHHVWVVESGGTSEPSSRSLP